MPKALHELLAQADELAARFEAYEPEPGDRDTVDPVTALHLAALRRAEAERELAAAVRRARDSNVAWRVIGDAVGTSGESARQRYGTSGPAVAAYTSDGHRVASGDEAKPVTGRTGRAARKRPPKASGS